MKTRTHVITLAVLLALAFTGMALAASGEPVLFPDWQSGNAVAECAQAGSYVYAYKIDAWGSSGMDGTYQASFDDGHLNYITVANNDGTTFDWSATPNPIGAVVVKGGPVANVFYYDPQAASDTGLYAPVNPNNGQNYGVSHVTFCWNPEVEIEYVYETAFAFGGDPTDCFLGFGFNRWGWSNGPIGPGVYTWPLYAGAAQCDLTKGTMVGQVTVVYDGVQVTVSYDLNAGVVLEESHVYAGYGRFPTFKGSPTVAPGQYKVLAPFDGSPIYLIVHGVAGIPVTP